MNSTQLSKNVKKKIMSTYKMGQMVASSPKSKSTCSIISVDEDVRFVVDNSDESEFSTPVPVDKSIELSKKTYSKKNPISHARIPTVNQKPFKFSILPDTKPVSSQCSFDEGRKKRKRVSLPDDFQSYDSRKMQKKDITVKALVPKSSRDNKCKPKAVFAENEISSDSDIEVLEIKVVNPDALNMKPMNNFVKKHVNNQTTFSNKKKQKDYVEPSIKNTEAKPALSKTCFVADNELVVNEADTAPYMPNNPTVFPDVRGASGSMKWLNPNGTLERRFGDHNTNRNNEVSSRNGESKPLLLPELKKGPIESKAIRSRELKSLYKNLNEILWTQETSFKNLLRNPDYIRHSERSTSRVTGKALRKVRENALKTGNKTTPLKKSPTVKAGLKKCKLAKLNTNKTLAKLIPKNKITNLNGNKIAKLDITKLTNSNKLNKLPIKNKLPELDSNINSMQTSKVEHIVEKTKKIKKQSTTSNGKIKICAKTKVETPKSKNCVKVKNSVLNEKSLVDPKTAVSEASSSGIQSSICKDISFYLNKQNIKEGAMRKFVQRKSIDTKNFEVVQKYKKNDRMYTSVRKGSQCSVRIQPLEHTSLWNTECYEDFKNQFLHQALRKVIEKGESNCITSTLQEMCESYSSPVTEDKMIKKKKPEEETVRSSARQIEGAFRYKEIVVKKLQNYMQVILVPNGVKKNCLTIDAIKELRDAFLLAKKDPKCRAVLLNSSGSYFCTGIDISQLVGPNKKQACEEMASVIKELVLVLGTFTKPVVAAVNGTALGFGVALLTYCDVVLASDKATFCIPSHMIGYTPEGGLTLMLPHVVGHVWSSEMMLQGTRLTAEQAHQKGLVTEVLWPTLLMNEVIPRMENIISQPLQVMEATKLLVRANTWDKLKSHMEMERRIIVNQWLSANCQNNIKRLLHTGLLFVE